MSVSPKTDDTANGIGLLGKCNNTTRAYSGSQVTYISPNVPSDAPLDRAGNPIYGNFNMSGNHDYGCRMTALHGHPQDYSRKLYNLDLNQQPFGWEERGIELYENFGLSEAVFPKPGNYGTVGPDHETYSSYDNGSNVGSKCGNGKSTSWGEQTCQNRCITELGRKLTLFGQTGFACFDNNSNNMTDPNIIKPTGFASAGFNYGYIINFYNNIRSDCGDTYDYYGNSGVIMKDANKTQWYFICGQQPYIVSSTYAVSYPSSTQLSWYLYDDDAKVLAVDLRYFDPTMISPLGINCNNIQASASTTTNCTGSANMDSLNLPAAPVPFPGNWYSQLFCDTGRTTDGYTSYANCNYSGFRSMYIPPHMRVDGFSTSLFVNNTANWSSATGTQTYNPVSYTGSTTFSTQAMSPITYDKSPYSNGVFPSLAGQIANSPLDLNSGLYTGSGYFSPSMHNCSMYSIWVNVRRDSAFTNRYVARWYSNDKLLPEILLIPGIQNAPTFIELVSGTNPVPNPLQQMQNPQDYWTKKNKYWKSGTVTLDTSKQPYDAIPSSTPVVSTVSLATHKVLNKIPLPNIVKKKILSTHNSLVNVSVSVATSVATAVPTAVSASLDYDTEDFRPQGTGRIKTFDPMNGIMSIEWIYVVYSCAFSYSPGQANSLTYDPGTMQYTCSNSNTCQTECMLYRDPFYYKSNGQTTSISDMFMKTFCGMKNLTLVYGKYSNPASNDCSCTTTSTFCPGTFNPSCDPTKMGTSSVYVPDGTINSTAACSDTCSYCSAVNVQLNIQNGEISSAKNNNIGTVGTCGNQPGCYAGGSVTSHSLLFILLIIFCIIITCVIGVLGYRKYIKETNI